MVMTGEYAPPSDSDHERFVSLLEDYADDVRAWLERVDGYLYERSKLLVAKVITSNDTKHDADRALITLEFPAGFAEGALSVPPMKPTAPKFPLRRSALSVMTRGVEASMPA
jgi:hypothetical protein